jgi:large subunit ribosomal protein L24
MIARIRKNDKVKVLSGKDKGKEGSVIALLPKEGKVMVKNVAIVTRHVKPRKSDERGGVQKVEKFISISSVMPICSSCNKPSRVNAKKLETGVSVRVCNRCKEVF